MAFTLELRAGGWRILSCRFEDGKELSGIAAEQQVVVEGEISPMILSGLEKCRVVSKGDIHLDAPPAEEFISPDAWEKIGKSNAELKQQLREEGISVYDFLGDLSVSMQNHKLSAEGEIQPTALDLLNQLKLVQSLSVHGSVSPTSLQKLSCVQTLRVFSYTGETLSAENLAVIKEWPAMREIRLQVASLSPAAMEALAGLRSLRTLSIKSPEDVSIDGDEIMSQIKSLPFLEKLVLDNVRTTDEGLSSLTQMQLLSLELSSPSLEGAGLVHISPSNQLSILTLRSCPLSADKFELPQSLPYLANISLTNSSFDDECLAKFPTLPRLGKLILDGTDVGDGLAAMIEATAPPLLNEISLQDTGISDVVLQQIGKAELPELRRLVLTRTQITDEGLKSLSGERLGKLEFIGLSGTAVSDEGLKAISAGQFPALRTIGAEFTDITDAGLLDLASLPKLTTVYISKDSKITPAGREQLKTAAPKLAVRVNTLARRQQP